MLGLDKLGFLVLLSFAFRVAVLLARSFAIASPPLIAGPPIF